VGASSSWAMPTTAMTSRALPPLSSSCETVPTS
jgi:hypothetical protein